TNSEPEPVVWLCVGLVGCVLPTKHGQVRSTGSVAPQNTDERRLGLRCPHVLSLRRVPSAPPPDHRPPDALDTRLRHRLGLLSRPHIGRTTARQPLRCCAANLCAHLLPTSRCPHRWRLAIRLDDVPRRQIVSHTTRPL